MAYEAKEGFAKNVETNVEVVSMLREHGSWLTNFYLNEAANFWQVYGQYSSRVMNDIGGLMGSMAQMGMSNMELAARTMKKYSATAEPMPVSYKIESAPVISEPIKEIELAVTEPYVETIMIENQPSHYQTPNRRMIIA